MLHSSSFRGDDLLRLFGRREDAEELSETVKVLATKMREAKVLSRRIETAQKEDWEELRYS